MDEKIKGVIIHEDDAEPVLPPVAENAPPASDNIQEETTKAQSGPLPEEAEALITEKYEAPLAKKMLLLLLIAIVFVASVMMVYLKVSDTETLVTDAQKLVYPLGAGVVVGMMVVMWLCHQTMFRDTKKQPGAWVFPVFTGFVTLVCAMMAYACVGMWPVGEESAMIVDLHHQYTPMLSQLRDMILNGGSPLYSFEIGSGTSFIPMFAYYLASPLNLLLLLFPQHLLAEGVLVITLIKMALMGAMMALCMQYIFKRRDFSLVLIGVMFALMMYNLAYSWNIMWLDCVMFLPLVVMGFEHMMRTGKYLLYVLSLAYVLYANYYIGFMICIFLVLYYIAFFFRVRRGAVKQRIGFTRFAIGSLLGGGLAAFILLPAFISLSGTSAAGGNLPEFATNFNVFELIGRGLYGVEPTVRSGNLPNTYCGVLAVLTLPLFATMSSIPLRRRLAYLGLFFMMAISLVINQLDLLWHGLHSPNDLPYRFSFLYSFALLLITFEVLYRIKEIKASQIGMSVFGIAVYLIIEEQFGTQEYSYDSLYLSFALIAVYAVIMLLISQKKMAARVGYSLIAVFVVAEMMFNAAVSLQQLNNNEHYTNHDSYLDNQKTQVVTELVAQMQAIGDEEMGDDFYRFEFTPDHTLVDTAMFDYRGIKIFASTGSYSMTRFMGSLGYDVNGVNSQAYRQYIPSADAMLSLRYIALDKDLVNHPYLEKIKTVKSEDGANTYHIYRNKAYLPVGFMAGSAIKEHEFEYYNPIVSQNTLYQALTGTTENIMITEPISTSMTNLASVTGDASFSMSGSGTGVFKAVVSETAETYVYVDCRAASSINVSVKGGSSWNVTTHQPYMVNAGVLNEGTEIEVRVTSNNGCSGNIYVSRLDQEVFNRDLDMLNDEALKITSFDDSSMEGVVNAKADGVMCMSIEYDAGWTVLVDGKEVDTFRLYIDNDNAEQAESEAERNGDVINRNDYGAMLGFEVGAGEHTITLKFMPCGLIPGIVISVVSLAALIALLVYLKKRDTAKETQPVNNSQSETEDKGGDNT